jgi:hypothetical protein
VRRFVAIALALSLLTSSVAGCSQPIDTGSSIPAQSQPIVALLALVGLGIGLTAWHHHNEHVASHGGGPTIFGAQFSVGQTIIGYKPVDLTVDDANVALGALELPVGGGGTGKLTELQTFSNTPQAFGTYSLPTNYAPTAVAEDPNGVAWFVNAAGLVQGCDVMTTTTTTCSSLGTFHDGLGVGSRSIAADTNFIVVIVDGGGGTVKWWAQQGTTATGTGTYTPASTSPIYAADAVELTSTSPSGFTVFHQDGSTEFITFSISGSTLTIAQQPNFIFVPAPVQAPPSNQALDNAGKVAGFGFTGTPSGSYGLTKYETTSSVGVGNPVTASELIELNGQVGNPGGGPFTSPLFSPKFDAGENSVWAIDQVGRIVNFAPF